MHNVQNSLPMVDFSLMSVNQVQMETFIRGVQEGCKCDLCPNLSVKDAEWASHENWNEPRRKACRKDSDGSQY